MLFNIIRNDWRNLRADRSLWIIGALLAVLIGYGVHNGGAWVRFQQDTLTQAAEEEAGRLTLIKTSIESANAGRANPPSWRDPRNPFAVGNTQAAHYVSMPPAPLAALAVGQSDLLPYYFKLSLKSRDTLLGNDEIENPVHLLSGRFDLAFVIIYLFPLLVLALSYNLISSEKEDGTLAMTLSQPVRLGTLAWGKAGFRALFILALSTLISLAGTLASGVNLSAAGASPRFLLWVAVVAAYGAFWFAAAVAVNALGRSSATNAIALAGLWLGFVLLIPALLNVTVKALHPVPSRVELIQAMRVASDDITRQRSQLMAKYLEDHPEFAAATDDSMAQYAIRTAAILDELDRRVQPVLATFDEQLTLQQAMVDRYRFLSPAILVQSALYDLAGTNLYRYRHFLHLTEQFHAAWRTHFEPLIARNVRLTPAHINSLPRFHFQEEPFQAVFTRTTAALAGLGLSALLAAALSAWWLRRYPVAA
ncbi:MAG: DUF3526 domain-containing protein [Acidobacteria bacterium]|nr:DUF3526 domain-containing protein [Acidobacteriota bacterium]